MALPSGRDDTISDEEILQRAIISKSQFARSKRRVKPSLMFPNPHVELSVSRIDGLASKDVKQLADDVASKRNKPASLGYGKFSAAMPRRFGLDVSPDEPPPHHANITGWADDSDPDERRRRQLHVAKQLVEEVKLVLWDEAEAES